MPNVKEMFRPMDSNKHIEEYSGRASFSKGAFSEEARDALALAVSRKKSTVQMDRYTMAIKYYDNHVAISPTDGSMLPCGCYNYVDLRNRKAKDAA